MDMVHGLKVGHLIELRYWQHGHGHGGGGGGSCFWQWVPWLTWYSPHPKCGGWGPSGPFRKSVFYPICLHLQVITNDSQQ